MAIKFNCPHCGKSLSVKDDSLAGKKAACTKCKKIVVIPRPEPAPAPAEDVEALALAALVDPKPEEARQETSSFEFECPQCAEKITMPTELAGKNAPCPECRRIIKVPVPKKKDPANWRQTDHLPTGARRDTEPAPEGAWDATKKTVSAGTMEAVGLIPKKRRPGMTRRQKVYWGIGAGAGVVALVVALGFAYHAWSQGKEEALVAGAVKAADGWKSKEAAAEVSRAAGEYHLRAGHGDSADKALKAFAKARGLLHDSAPGAARDLLLADLLVAQVDLAGGEADVAKGTHVKGDAALKELKQTHAQLTTPGGRLHALRRLAARLIAAGRPQEAVQFAGLKPPPPPAGGEGDALPYEEQEALAVVGIELFRAEHKDEAAKLADRAAAPYAVPDGPGAKRPPLAPSALALCVATGKPEPKAGPADADNYAAGRATGLALAGDAAPARGVKAEKPEGQLLLLVMLAEATGDAADVDAAVNFLDGEVKDEQLKAVSPWLVYRLARLAAKPGQADRVLHVADRISDAGLKAGAQLEAVRARLAATTDKAGDSALDGIGDGALPQGPAREALARHNARLDYGGTLKAVEGWDEAVRPFGTVGAVLGAQDKGK